MTMFSLNAVLVPLLVAVATPAAAANSPFDGTWKVQLSSLQRQAKPDSYSLQNGTYTCSTCQPAYSVKADGAFHALKGHDYWDEVAVTVVDDHVIKTAFKKDGAVKAENTETVSPDGNTINWVNHNTLNGGNVPIDVSASATRVGKPVAGAHLISGTWNEVPPQSISDQSLTMTIALADGMLHLRSGLGETLDAKLGGDYAPNVGDPGKTLTKVEQVDPHTLRLTDKRAGKVVEVTTYTIADDGMLHGQWRNPQTGDTGGFTAARQ